MTKIEWTDRTWNPVTGCTKVSPGCDNCYAETMATRFGGRDGFRVQLHPDRLSQPPRWRKPGRVFVCSMADLFHDAVPDEYIAQVWGVMAATPRQTFQVLTKRHGRMRSLLSDHGWPAYVAEVYGEHHDGQDFTVVIPPALPNVWLGVSVEDQKRADLRIHALLQTPAAVRFLSCEPLLGPVDLRNLTGGGGARIDVLQGDVKNRAGEVYAACPTRIDWVIAGGESGAGARPMHPDWARSLRDQCAAAGVPYLFKQWGEHLPVPVFDAPEFAGGRAFKSPKYGGTTSATLRERGPSRTFRGGETRLMQPGDRNGHGVMLDADTIACRVGKGAAGRELDGRTWDEFPADAS